MKNITSAKNITSVLLKIVVILSVIVGVVLSAYASRNTFMGGRTLYMYFTIQSNIAVAIICAIGLVHIIRGHEVGTVWSIIKFVGTVSITLTGIVFCFVLAPTLGVYAWNLQNVLTHVVVPVVAVMDFFVMGGGLKLKKKHVIYVIIPPLLYAVYAGIGYAAGWQFSQGVNYPYFFLNWGSPLGAFGFGSKIPYMGCVWWILALLIFLIVVGFGYLNIVDLLNIKRDR
ncbi:MAG: Pr6Pr family membrane protein [Lachnospiraceae bacterium]|nr:Pr6Pr family membrane protein [Lachnospiraceae bacterium]